MRYDLIFKKKFPEKQTLEFYNVHYVTKNKDIKDISEFTVNV